MLGSGAGPVANTSNPIIRSGYLATHNIEASPQFQIQRNNMLRLQGLADSAQLAGIGGLLKLRLFLVWSSNSAGVSGLFILLSFRCVSVESSPLSGERQLTSIPKNSTLSSCDIEQRGCLFTTYRTGNIRDTGRILGLFVVPHLRHRPRDESRNPGKRKEDSTGARLSGKNAKSGQP
jgi:hypothetical protein